MVPRPRYALIHVLIALLLCAAISSGQEVRRHVLALVPGKTADPELENAVHQLLETPLNYLGLVVDHHYIETGPPPEELVARAHAVVTWFDSATANPDWLWPWLEKEVPARKLRVVHFGGFGPLARNPVRLAKWLANFGLETPTTFAKGAYRVRVEFIDEKLCKFEADARETAIHHGPRSVSENNRPWVTTSARDNPKSVCHPVVTGPWGAVALEPWGLRMGWDHDGRRWHLNPFEFFREALGMQRVPAPHPSVLNGRRMWICQVDGDGFESFSTIESGQYAAKVMKDRIFEKYQLPFTVSIIVRSLTRDYKVAEDTRAMKLAQEIFRLPNIEPASHGVLHTLRWRQELKADSPQRSIMWYAGLQNYEYSQVAEVRDSIAFINERLTPPSRPCVVMLWTGEANPREDALEQVARSGCINLNGGVFRWDAWHDSLGFCTPWTRRVGKALQVYAGAANENDFAGFFDTMPGSFRHIDSTIERAGAPRILKPADLYIHFYSAETPARLRPLHTLIKRWAFKERTAPVYASTYVRSVTSAVETARIARTPTGWRLSAFGDCRSVRIDDEPRTVDLTRSKGVLGFLREGRRLRIHLSQQDAEIVLVPRAPRRPHVEQANCLLENAALGAKGLSFTAVAANARRIVVAGLTPNKAIKLLLDGAQRDATTDAEGRLSVNLAQPGRTTVVISE